jgi:hypothetical protein
VVSLLPLQSELEGLSPEEKAVLTRVARKIVDLGFVTPAVFFLEMVKPLALLGSHFLVFIGPIVSAFLQADRYYRATELLEEPRNVEFLISEIERLDRESNSATKPEE